MDDNRKRKKVGDAWPSQKGLEGNLATRMPGGTPLAQPAVGGVAGGRSRTGRGGDSTEPRTRDSLSAAGRRDALIHAAGDAASASSHPQPGAGSGAAVVLCTACQDQKSPIMVCLECGDAASRLATGPREPDPHRLPQRRDAPVHAAAAGFAARPVNRPGIDGAGRAGAPPLQQAAGQMPQVAATQRAAAIPPPRPLLQPRPPSTPASQPVVQSAGFPSVHGVAAGFAARPMNRPGIDGAGRAGAPPLQQAAGQMPQVAATQRAVAIPTPRPLLQSRPPSTPSSQPVVPPAGLPSVHGVAAGFAGRSVIVNRPGIDRAGRAGAPPLQQVAGQMPQVAATQRPAAIPPPRPLLQPRPPSTPASQPVVQPAPAGLPSGHPQPGANAGAAVVQCPSCHHPIEYLVCSNASASAPLAVDPRQADYHRLPQPGHAPVHAVTADAESSASNNPAIKQERAGGGGVPPLQQGAPTAEAQQQLAPSARRATWLSLIQNVVEYRLSNPVARQQLAAMATQTAAGSAPSSSMNHPAGRHAGSGSGEAPPPQEAEAMASAQRRLVELVWKATQDYLTHPSVRKNLVAISRSPDGPDIFRRGLLPFVGGAIDYYLNNPLAMQRPIQPGSILCCRAHRQNAPVQRPVAKRPGGGGGVRGAAPRGAIIRRDANLSNRQGQASPAPSVNSPICRDTEPDPFVTPPNSCPGCWAKPAIVRPNTIVSVGNVWHYCMCMTCFRKRHFRCHFCPAPDFVMG